MNRSVFGGKDLHPLDAVAGQEPIDGFHPSAHASHPGIAPVEMGSIGSNNEQLDPARIQACQRHPHRTPNELLKGKFGRYDFLCAAVAVPTWIPALNDESRHHPVKGQSVVAVLANGREDLSHCGRRVLGTNVHLEVPGLGHEAQACRFGWWNQRRRDFHRKPGIGCGSHAKGPDPRASCKGQYLGVVNLQGHTDRLNPGFETWTFRLTKRRPEEILTHRRSKGPNVFGMVGQALKQRSQDGRIPFAGQATNQSDGNGSW